MIDPAEAAAAAPLVKAVASAAMDHAPVVKTTSGEAVATGVWTLVGIVVTTIGALVGLWMRVGPKWSELGLGAKRSAFARLDARIDKLEKQVLIETAARVKSEKQVSYVVAAFSMVSAELERESPGNMVIKQARDMVALAMSNDGLSGDLIRALDMTPDVPLNGGKL